MIVSFKHRGLKRLYQRDESSRLPPDMVRRIASLLAALADAQRIEDLDRPSFDCIPLRGPFR